MGPISPEVEKIIQKHHASVAIKQSPTHKYQSRDRLFDNKILFTIADVASLAGCSTRTIERLIKKGELKATKVGRKKLIRKEWIESWLQPTEV